MKIKELKENEPVELIEVIRTLYPTFDNSLEPIKNKYVQTKIITDGEIVKEEEITKSINEYYIGRKKYDDVDTLSTKNIYLKNYSYVIVYLLAKEKLYNGNMVGFFDIIKDVSIYLKNPKDKQALKEAKKVIKTIHKHNQNVDYSSIFNMLFQSKDDINYKIEKISKNVYTLKK